MMNDEWSAVHKAQQGDAEAFALLVEEYQGPVYRLALKMGLSPADAEEAAQEAFVAAWRGLPQFRRESKFSTWLYQLTTHAAIDLLRREKRHSGSADIDECLNVTDGKNQPEEAAAIREEREAVAKAMAELSPEYREILLLRYMQQQEYEEIAQALHLPKGTVKSRINRAKAHLKEILLRQGNFFGADDVQNTKEVSHDGSL